MYFIKFINRSFFDSLILPLTRICCGLICRIVASMMLLLVLCVPVSADVPPLLPMPQKVSMTDKWVTADRDVCFTKVDRVECAESQDEAYRLVVDKHNVNIYATGDAGLFRAKQTLEQLTTERKGKKRNVFPSVTSPTGLHSVYVDLCTTSDAASYRWTNLRRR